MAIVKMQKISIISLNSEKNQIFDVLQKNNIIQIIEKNKKDTLNEVLKNINDLSENEDLEKTIDEIKYAIDFCDKYYIGKKPSMLQSFISDKTNVDFKEYLNFKNINFQKIIKQIKQIDENLVLAENKLSKNNSLLNQLKDYSWINIKIDKIKSLNNFSYTIGKIQAQHYQKFYTELDKKLKKIFLMQSKILAGERFVKFILIYRNTDKNIVENIIKNSSIEQADFLKNFSPSPKEIFETLKKENAQIINEKKQLIDRAQILSNNKINFMCLYDTYSWKFDNLKQKNNTSNSDYAFIITGWIPQNKILLLRKIISQITNSYEIIIEKIHKNEEIPILLENPKYLKPFEAVTNIYGMPKYNEPDPTGYLAIFFIIFFGLCLTDAGYGLIIIIITSIVLKYVDLPDKRLVTLLNIGGWATLIIGSLTGGWFGIDINALNYKPLANILSSIRIIDPISNPIAIMGLALALGIIQVWYGIVVKFRWKLNSEKRKEAIYDDAPWILLIPALIFFALTKLGVLTNDLYFISLFFLIFSLILVVLSKSRNQKNIFLKIPVGILGLYDLIGYLSDTLSYSRLLALGLATGIIGLVVNMIASLFGKIPYIGWLIFIVILLGGHAFNIAINLLGAFIHSARLQYVEFFNKFLEGGGKRFDPFSRKNTYINIKNN